MDHSASLPARARRTRRIVLVSLATLGVAIGALVVHRPLVASAPSSHLAEVGQSTGMQTAFDEADPSGPPEGAEHGRPERLPGRGGQATGIQTALDEADGLIPDGVAVSVFNEEIPAVGKLDPDLLDALHRAATDALADGVGLQISSGWRSSEYQQRLLQDAVVEYGSLEEAARWVATAETSAHVTGDAVDVGPRDAQAWLSEHGAAYGLCQIYSNESWHYELRSHAVYDGCPPAYADPTEDPRMQP